MPPHNEHNDHEPRCVNADSQAWHITFGTYATRLHEDPRPTVDRRHNHVGTPFPPPDPARQQKPSELPLRLTREQREHIEKTIPHLCDKGGWVLTTCAAQPDHIHILLSAPHQTHGKLIRKWLKRWLSGSLTQTFGPPPMRWWSAGGSPKPSAMRITSTTQRVTSITNADKIDRPRRHDAARNCCHDADRDCW